MRAHISAENHRINNLDCAPNIISTHPAPPVTSTVLPVPDMSGDDWICKTGEKMKH